MSMPKYLNEHQVGFDTSVIGFPNLGDCLAVVLQTTGGLFGFHITPGNARQSGSFATFIQQKLGLGGVTTVQLYGSCHWGNRYKVGAAAKWQTEMQEIASALGHVGPVSGFDSSTGRSRIAADETTYIEYRMDRGGGCTIHYKRMAKMNVQSAFGSGDGDTGLVRRDMALTTDVWNPVFRLGAASSTQITSAAAVQATRSNKGELHAVRASELHAFTST
jgi:hypothetical protein